jgi:arylsulfatase A-like enzyme
MNVRIDRRAFVKSVGIGAATVALADLEGCMPARRQPNIVLIVADDLGYGELGSYGQQKIRTPNLDRMAVEGMRFTQHYSGSPVCAPSRCVLLTGMHTGHAYIRGNDEMAYRGDVWHDLSLEGQRPLLPNTTTIATLLQEAGYVTGAMGKWGLGGPGSTGEPNRQGFDYWYGYLGQRLAHNYYPVHLWRNTEKRELDNEYFHPHQRLPATADPDDPASYEPYSGKQYSMDLIVEEALGFIRRHQDRPFFLYLPFTIPHVSLQVPAESVEEYAGAFPDTPYPGDRGYTPHRTPRAAYAAMITRMDGEIGRIMSLIAELGLDQDTIVLFTSDNGPTFNGGTDSEFFESAGPLRGLKQDLYEGGIRVPLIARWPGRVAAGTVNDHVSSFWDYLPTLTALAGATTPSGIDGVSLLPTLEGRPEAQRRHEHLYWEYSGAQAVRLGDWKAVRSRLDVEIELYDLSGDIAEQHDVASQHPDIVQRIEEIMQSDRTESELFPLIRQP